MKYRFGCLNLLFYLEKVVLKCYLCFTFSFWVVIAFGPCKMECSFFLKVVKSGVKVLCFECS